MVKATKQKTDKCSDSVIAFIDALPFNKRSDAKNIAGLMTTISGLEPKMWGGSMIGFGQRHYKYASGHEGDTFLIGFASRAKALTLYVATEDGGVEAYSDLLAQLGKHSAGKGCLNIPKLGDIDMGVLEAILIRAMVSASKGSKAKS